MGIPSYFRRILQAYPGCMSKVSPPNVKALCFDFNCLIYRCLRAPTMPVWSEERSDEWEEDLLREVCRTVKEVYVVAGRPKQVYLAVDGVVPMAKIRQQRVRRFKSVWMRTLENTQASWDSNAITPGTAFMDKLGIALRKLASEHRGWEVSDVHEPGEGEHKILRWLRGDKLGQGKQGNVLVYGLDADLILLTMLAGTQLNLPLWLIREKQEFAGGGLQQPLPGEIQEYTCMNLKEFQERLGVKGVDQTLQYIALMSLMGNDFLPHSLSHKLGDDGHDYVIKMLKSGLQVVNSKGELNVNALQQISAKWAEDEEEKVAKMIAKKQEQAGRGVLKGMKEMEGLPLTWNVEQAFLDQTGRLSPQWRSVYWQHIHPQGQTPEFVQQLCQEYVYGCQWVLDYYTGKSVDQGWMFPAWVPPLWSDLAKTDVKGWDTKERKPQMPIQPQEQLAMVLPVESWKFIRDRKLQTLPEKLPQYWPEKFGFFSLGRKWLWECEALIPPLRVERVRGIL
jgi:5'-3' exonuclease